MLTLQRGKVDLELPPPNSGIKQPAENADTAER
jgi:hypothetical protein